MFKYPQGNHVNEKFDRALADLAVEREKVKALQQAIESLADKFQKWAEEARREVIDPQHLIGEVVMKQRPQEIIHSEAVMLDICAREVRALLQPAQPAGEINE